MCNALIAAADVAHQGGLSGGEIIAIVTAIVAGVVNIAGMIIGFLTLWLKIKYGAEKAEAAVTKAEAAVVTQAALGKKIDDNTKITKAGVEAVSVVAKKLNGGLDEALKEATEPIKERLAQHEQKITEIAAYHHKAKHDLVGAIDAVNTKVVLLLKLSGVDLPQQPDQRGETPPP